MCAHACRSQSSTSAIFLNHSLSPPFFIFKQQSLWAWSSPQGKTSGLASLRDPPVYTSSEREVYTSCPALHLGLRFSSLSHLPLLLLKNSSSVLCVCHSVTIPVTICSPFHLRFICNYEYVSVSVGVMYTCELQEVGTHLVWVLGTEFRSSGRAGSPLPFRLPLPCFDFREGRNLPQWSLSLPGLTDWVEGIQ